MRSFAFFLTLTVVFLLGLVIGIDRDKSEQDKVSANINHIDVMSSDDIAKEDYEEEFVFVDVAPDVSEPFTQKAAFFLESGVKVFYDIVVETLYQISSLVFK